MKKIENDMHFKIMRAYRHFRVDELKKLIKEYPYLAHLRAALELKER